MVFACVSQILKYMHFNQNHNFSDFNQLVEYITNIQKMTLIFNSFYKACFNKLICSLYPLKSLV